MSVSRGPDKDGLQDGQMGLGGKEAGEWERRDGELKYQGGKITVACQTSSTPRHFAHVGSRISKSLERGMGIVKGFWMSLRGDSG